MAIITDEAIRLSIDNEVYVDVDTAAFESRYEQVYLIRLANKKNEIGQPIIRSVLVSTGHGRKAKRLFSLPSIFEYQEGAPARGAHIDGSVNRAISMSLKSGFEPHLMTLREKENRSRARHAILTAE